MRVFGTAGVRGVFNRSQTVADVYKLVQTATFVFGRGRYGVGWDGRKSSTVLGRAAISASVSAGSDAIVFGCVPTPVVAFGTRESGCLAGFSVTASHNPPEFSGVKLFDRKGMEIGQDVESNIERALVVNSWKSSANFGDVVDRDDLLDEYVDLVIQRFAPAKRALKVVVDCAGGPGALVTPGILKRLGHRVIPVNTQLSWRFSARQPEPTSASLRDTCNLVRESGADLGFAHDGDADRLVLINSEGEVLPDAILPIIFLRNTGKSGAVILSENTSSAVAEEAEHLGFRVVRGRIGKTFVEIARNGAIMASEPSKLVDPSWGMWEDGIYAASMVCDFISRNFSDFIDLSKSARWLFKQINLPVAVDLARLSVRIDNLFERFRIQEKREEFGLKLVFRDQSWIMFRPSGTEPKTRIYCESKDGGRLEELLQEGVRCVEMFPRT